MHDDDVTGDLSGVYLRRQDFDNGDLAFVVASADKVAFEARQGKPAQQKWVLTFASEPVRKWSLNRTNLALMAKLFGKRTRLWVDKEIVLFLDESVSFGGQLVGGIRIRTPKRRAESVTATETTKPETNF